jgi:hypothetical protein
MPTGTLQPTIPSGFLNFEITGPVDDTAAVIPVVPGEDAVIFTVPSDLAGLIIRSVRSIITAEYGTGPNTTVLVQNGTSTIHGATDIVHGTGTEGTVVTATLSNDGTEIVRGGGTIHIDVTGTWSIADHWGSVYVQIDYDQLGRGDYGAYAITP